MVFERGQALVLGILALALLSTAWAAEDTSSAITTTTRYASFALVYVILTQFGHDRVLQRRIAWTLTITCSIAAGLGLHYYLSGSAQLATLPHAQQNDYAFILATSLPFMFLLLGSTRLAPAAPLWVRSDWSRRRSCSASRVEPSSGWRPASYSSC